MAKYKIIPNPTFETEIEATSADDTIIDFAATMDTDMNQYFIAVQTDVMDPVLKTYAETYIKELAYELYKLDWMRRISTDRQMDKMKDYYEECVTIDLNPCTGDAELHCTMSLEEYLNNIDGYNGELYVCFKEFIDNEYQDEEFMKALFGGNNNLYQAYLEDIQCEEKDLNTAAGLQQYFEAEFEKTVQALLKDNESDNEYSLEDARQEAMNYFLNECYDYCAIAGMYINHAAGDTGKALDNFLSKITDENHFECDKAVINKLRRVIINQSSDY